MVKHIDQKKDHSGELYDLNGTIVKVMPLFIYEVSLYKIWKQGFSLLGIRYFSSDILLKIKNDKIIDRYANYIIEKSITLVGVPKDFIIKYNIPLYIQKTKKK